jgi:hypothetical protein
MKLSFGVALAGLIFVEYLRLGKIAPLGTYFPLPSDGACRMSDR